MVIARTEVPNVPAAARGLFREAAWTEDTRAICSGFTNANLVIVPKEMAYDFLLFCQRNPKPCPCWRSPTPETP